MAAAFRSIATATFSAATSGVVNKPANLAVGDMMIVAAAAGGGLGNGINGQNGFTSLGSISAGAGGLTVGWKIATSGDVAATNFTFNWDGGSVSGGMFMMACSGNSNVIGNTVLTQVNNTTTPSFSGITPFFADNLLIMIVASDVENLPVGSYAVATDNPTWTEQFEHLVTSGINATFAVATGPRNSANATGSASFIMTGSASTTDYGCCLIEVRGVQSATLTPNAITIATSVPAPALSYGSTKTPSAITVATSVPAPAVSAEDNAWSGVNKSSAPSWSNPQKS